MNDNRILIKEIYIKNFRSIKSAKLKIQNNNIFVGLNDVGKSNLLKSLNLFFNGQTDYGEVFDFKKDFTYLHSKNSHARKEIKIAITFFIPPRYKANGQIVWEKSWYIDGTIAEKMKYKNSRQLPKKSKVPGVLRNLKFRYVPAVKSRDYYKGLLSELYLAVSSSLNSPLQSSIATFSKVLSDYTEAIGNETSSKLGLISRLTMPEDLNDLFKILIFETTDNNSNLVVNLERRGDGIQARHIPYILRYISAEDQKSRDQRATNIYTIWGFEEPENGLELAKSFEMAKDFMDYSKEIQMFISTHSPAFYLNKENDDSTVFYVDKGESGETIYSNENDINNLHISMGIMPVIAPYIKEKQIELEKYRKLISESLSEDIDTILVEGKYDQLYLTEAIKIYSSQLYDRINNRLLRIYTKSGEGGCKKIVDTAKGLYYYGNKSKIYAIFDRDEAGVRYKKELIDFINSDSRVEKIKSKHWEFTTEMKLSCRSKVVPIVEIEHFLSPDFWDILISEGKVEKKSYLELQKMFEQYVTIDKSLLEIADEFASKDEQDFFFNKYNPKDSEKEFIYQMAMKKLASDNPNVLLGLEPTVKKLEEYFL